MGFFNSLLRRYKRPRLDWIQIEVTSLCGASCFYCPHTVYRDRWDHGSMSLETFRTMSGDFGMANLIYLQGWGEPFLNREIFGMIETAKKGGSKVGLTTNGMFLKPETIDALIDLKLDILGISLTGTKAEHHNRLRAGTDFSQITSGLLDLKARKAEKKSRVPHVHLAYLMVRSNFDDLRDIIPYAEAVDSRQIVCSNLNFFPGPELRDEALFLDEGKAVYYDESLKRIRSEAAKRAVNLFFYNPVLPDGPLPACPENILKSCFISYDGQVSGCVFTNIPLKKDAADALPGRIVYGDIHKNSLPEIWDSDAYKNLRNMFTTRQRGAADIDILANMDTLHPNDGTVMNPKGHDADDDLPAPCRSCYRMFGV